MSINDILASLVKGAQTTATAGLKTAQTQVAGIQTTTMTALSAAQRAITQPFQPAPQQPKTQTVTVTPATVSTISRDPATVFYGRGYSNFATPVPSPVKPATKATAKVVSPEPLIEFSGQSPFKSATETTVKVVTPPISEPPPTPMDVLTLGTNALQDAVHQIAKAHAPITQGVQRDLGRSIQNAPDAIRSTPESIVKGIGQISRAHVPIVQDLKRDISRSIRSLSTTPAHPPTTIQQRQAQYIRDVEQFNANPAHTRLSLLTDQYKTAVQKYENDPELQRYEQNLVTYNTQLSAYQRAVSLGRVRPETVTRLQSMQRELDHMGSSIESRKKQEFAEIQNLESSITMLNTPLRAESLRLQAEERALGLDKGTSGSSGVLSAGIGGGGVGGRRDSGPTNILDFANQRRDEADANLRKLGGEGKPWDIIPAWTPTHDVFFQRLFSQPVIGHMMGPAGSAGDIAGKIVNQDLAKTRGELMTAYARGEYEGLREDPKAAVASFAIGLAIPGVGKVTPWIAKTGARVLGPQLTPIVTKNAPKIIKFGGYGATALYGGSVLERLAAPDDLGFAPTPETVAGRLGKISSTEFLPMSLGFATGSRVLPSPRLTSPTPKTSVLPTTTVGGKKVATIRRDPPLSSQETPGLRTETFGGTTVYRPRVDISPKKTTKTAPLRQGGGVTEIKTPDQLRKEFGLRPRMMEFQAVGAIGEPIVAPVRVGREYVLRGEWEKVFPEQRWVVTEIYPRETAGYSVTSDVFGTGARGGTIQVKRWPDRRPPERESGSGGGGSQQQMLISKQTPQTINALPESAASLPEMPRMEPLLPRRRVRVISEDPEYTILGVLSPLSRIERPRTRADSILSIDQSRRPLETSEFWNQDVHANQISVSATTIQVPNPHLNLVTRISPNVIESPREDTLTGVIPVTTTGLDSLRITSQGIIPRSEIGQIPRTRSKVIAKPRSPTQPKFRTRKRADENELQRLRSSSPMGKSSHWELGPAPGTREMAGMIFGSGQGRSLEGSVLDFGAPSIGVTGAPPAELREVSLRSLRPSSAPLKSTLATAKKRTTRKRK